MSGALLELIPSDSDGAADGVVMCVADAEMRELVRARLVRDGLMPAGAQTVDEALALAPRLVVCGHATLDAPALAQLRDLTRQRVSVVAVCGVASGRAARLAVDRGVAGLVFTDRLAALAPTVHAVLNGQTAVPSGLRASLRRPTLSFREKQILALVLLGYTNSQIGARLVLAESTVKSHLSSSFVKLGVRSRSDAAALILDPEESRGLGIVELARSLANAPLEARG